jgi:hypothetical protein
MNSRVFQIFCYLVIPIVGGAAGALRGSEWLRLWHFIVENQQWFLMTLIWLFVLGVIWLFAEASTPEALKRKRIIGYIVVTLWFWGAMFYGLIAYQQVPVIQQHIDPPTRWWK